MSLPPLPTVSLHHPTAGGCICNVEDVDFWLAKGFRYKNPADAPARGLLDLPTFRPEWLEAFAGAGLDLSGVAHSTVEDLDALPVKHLGRVRAGKLIAEAAAALGLTGPGGGF
jgi:hypothetical protein